MNASIVLASASPRRRELLGLITKNFEVAVSLAEEKVSVPQDWPPEQLPGFLARVKAEDVAARHPDKLVIGSDTGVLVADESGKLQMLGKPTGAADARRMLRLLSGRKHLVSTGCCLCYRGKSRVFVEMAEVEFYPLAEAEIDAYLAGTDWEGKAGAYGIQDAFGMKYIKGISGDYYSIVGLPVSRLYHEMKQLGFEV